MRSISVEGSSKSLLSVLPPHISNLAVAVSYEPILFSDPIRSITHTRSLHLRRLHLALTPDGSLLVREPLFHPFHLLREDNKSQRGRDFGKLGRKPGGLLYDFPKLVHMVRPLGVLDPAHGIRKSRGGAGCPADDIETIRCAIVTLVGVSRHVIWR